MLNMAGDRKKFIKRPVLSVWILVLLCFLFENRIQSTHADPAVQGRILKVVLHSEPVPPSVEYKFNITIEAFKVNVTRFEMGIQGRGLCNVSTSDTTFICGPLLPGQEYNYTITAYAEENGTLVATGHLKTAPARARSVTKIEEEITAYNATIKWDSPAYPNGKISHYEFSAKALDGDYKCVSCFRCHPQAAKVRNSNCHLSTPDNNITCSKAESKSNCSTFYVQVLNLQPCTKYNISISAVNEKGQGLVTQRTFQTKRAAANYVNNVNLDSARNSETGRIELTIHWTPGDYTGPTLYNISVEEEIFYNSNRYDYRTNEEDINSTTFVVDDVFAHWKYKACVYAYTDMGGSGWVCSKPHQTAENIPGVIQNLDVIQDKKVAQLFTVEFDCPKEIERNGTIIGYVIKQTLLKPSDEEEHDKYHYVDSTNCKNSVPLKEVILERTYTFAVMATNSKGYNGTFSAERLMTFKPRKPQLLKLVPSVSSIIRKNTLIVSDEKEIDITVCVSCLRDSRQGDVQLTGLVVCVKKNDHDHQCNITDTSGTHFTTWKKAKRGNFQHPYRTTQDDWIKLLPPETTDHNVTIGENNNCDAVSIDVYCNGQLPVETTVIIYVYACTEAGCDFVHSEDIPMEKKSEESSSISVTAAVLCTLALTLIACVIVILVFRKRSTLFSTRWSLKQTSQEPEISNNRPVKMREFEDHVIKLHKDSNLLFQDEFECIKNLCTAFSTSCNEAQHEANRIKNRYVDILPYDHSRVKLDVQPEDSETNDFINANYIPGFNSVREYIATQGPMHCTVPDFWRMAWEQKCYIIVMLSDLQESGKLKVDQYWPENMNEPFNFEGVVVEMTNFSQMNKYIIRNFRITKGDDVRKVTQFFLPGWWDFSANLNFDDVLEFVHLVRQEVTPETLGPIIVHCSAGVGRTGTMIALDYFMQYVDKHSLDDEVDIFNYVLQMRKNRTRMVQAESQYIFIFDAVLEIIKKKINSDQEARSQSRRSSQDASIEQLVNFQVEDEKCAYNNAAFESEDSKKDLNGITDKPVSDKSISDTPVSDTPVSEL